MKQARISEWDPDIFCLRSIVRVAENPACFLAVTQQSTLAVLAAAAVADAGDEDGVADFVSQHAVSD